MVIKLQKLIVASVLAASSCFASATLINPLDQFDPGSFNINPNVTNWGRGWQFSVNADDVWVTQLGLITPTTGNYSLSLFDVSAHTEIASIDNLSGGNSWEFFDIAPIELSNGSNYIVELFGIGTNAYYFSTAFTEPTGTIDYVDMKYCNSCAPGTYPTNTLQGYMYGIPDISYQIGAPTNQVPEPSILALVGMGLAGAGFVRRRKQQAQA